MNHRAELTSYCNDWHSVLVYNMTWIKCRVEEDAWLLISYYEVSESSLSFVGHTVSVFTYSDGVTQLFFITTLFFCKLLVWFVSSRPFKVKWPKQQSRPQITQLCVASIEKRM